MPVKVRCKGCQKVLNVPDRARGKSVKCPNCETVLRIPAPGATAASGGGKKRRPSAPAVERDDFLAGMDLRRAADTRVRVCVKCGTEVEDEEIIDCPECGHNVDTGIMSDYIRKKRERKGPDPEEFWGVAWTGSFKFVGKNIPLILRTGGYWTAFITLIIFSRFCQALCTNEPPKVFWGAMAFMFSLGVYGWYWYCCINIIQHTMSPKRNKKMDSLHFDFFQCVALGIKAHVWPYILLLPVVLATIIALIVPLIGSAIAAGFSGLDIESIVTLNLVMIVVVVLGILVLALLIYPLAMVHMSMPYTYKAWTPYHMAICVGKNILPSLYWFVMALAGLLPILVTLLVLHISWDGGLRSAIFDIFVGIGETTLWIMTSTGMIEKLEDGSGLFKIPYIFIPVAFGIAFLLIAVAAAPFAIINAFSAVFLMRANGYVGLYFRDKLDLVKEQPANIPCGFWPRYLAKLVDYVVLSFAGTLVGLVLFGLALLVVWAELGYLLYIINFSHIAYLLTFPWYYYAKPESNPAWRGSIGKRALGIVVVQDNEEFKTLDIGTASGRFWLMALLGLVTLGVSWLMAAFSEKKQALHDSMLKTLVVWEGDDERSG